VRVALASGNARFQGDGYAGSPVYTRGFSILMHVVYNATRGLVCGGVLLSRARPRSRDVVPLIISSSNIKVDFQFIMCFITHIG
jgi:hypothetical protein